MSDEAIHDDALRELRDSAAKISVAYIASRLRIVEIEHDKAMETMSNRIQQLELKADEAEMLMSKQKARLDDAARQFRSLKATMESTPDQGK